MRGEPLCDGEPDSCAHGDIGTDAGADAEPVSCTHRRADACTIFAHAGTDAKPDSSTNDEPNTALHGVPQPEPDQCAFTCANDQPHTTAESCTYECTDALPDALPDALSDELPDTTDEASDGVPYALPDEVPDSRSNTIAVEGQ